MDAYPNTKRPLDGPVQSGPMPAAARLDVQEPGDCLALLKHTFGALPRESLVVIGLLDGCTGGHMRIDLGPALREPFASARLVADCLAGEGSSPAPEAALVVLIGEGAASPAQDSAWRSCLEALRVMLDSEYCVRIVQAWFVSPDHVRDPLCGVPGCCTFPGRSLHELKIPVLGGLPGREAARETLPLDQVAEIFLELLRAADPALESLVEELRRHEGGPRQREHHRQPLIQRRRLAAWDFALNQQTDAVALGVLTAGSPGASTPDGETEMLRSQAEEILELLRQLRTGSERDLLIPLATLGLDHAIIGLRQSQSAEETPLDPEEQQLWQDYALCFLGETRRRPNWERVDALESVLCGLVPYALGAERENLLCLMAWIEWARGRGTAAGSFIDRCLQEFPENEFSRLIERLMQLKGVCLWARVKQHSWSWSRR